MATFFITYSTLHLLCEYSIYIHIIEGRESDDDRMKKFCQPKFSATNPDVGDSNPRLKADIDINIE
jgi:hypothetical protein